MNLEPFALELAPQLASVRQDIHKHPETAYEEHRTAAMVAARLEALGYAVTTGLGGTGVVGTLRVGTADRAIGLRADMDALPMEEAENHLPYRSIHGGKFHGCGHDGHTAMLLGAAEVLAKTKRFEGTVHLIFQPAEEGEGGAMAMARDGLFDTFPMTQIFGLHNWPGLPLGSFGVRPGPLMAAFSKLDITIQGKGGHAALPHQSADPLVAASAVAQALQSVVARNLDPVEPAVLSITQMHGGSAYNVIPERVTMAGCTRYFSDEVGTLLHNRVRAIVAQVASGLGCTGTLAVDEAYTALHNDPKATETCVAVAGAVVGAANVNATHPPIMASEDFAFMLRQKPGCYVLMGTGGEGHGCMVHNPGYDFNDAALPIGVSYWVRLTEHLLRA